MKTKEEWIDLMHQQDIKVGAIDGTLEEDNQGKRLERLDMFTEVTEAVVNYCEENNIKYVLCQNVFTKRQHTHHITDVYLPEYKITMIHQDPNNEMHIKAGNYFFKINRKFFSPFFIRTTESKDYVLMKLANAIESARKDPRRGMKSIKFIPVKKRKRTRITAIKVERKIF